MRRFKTEAEFIQDYGNNWHRSFKDCTWQSEMDELFGTPYLDKTNLLPKFRSYRLVDEMFTTKELPKLSNSVDLLEEAKRRGFKKGVRYKNTNGVECNAAYDPKFYSAFSIDVGWSQGLIYENGLWGYVIEESNDCSLVIGSYYRVIDETFGKDFKIVFKASSIGIVEKGSYTATGAFISNSASTSLFNSSQGTVCYKSGVKRHYSLASIEEKEWLDYCIKESKFVSYEDYLKSKESKLITTTIFNVGDSVTSIEKKIYYYKQDSVGNFCLCTELYELNPARKIKKIVGFYIQLEGDHVCWFSMRDLKLSFPDTAITVSAQPCNPFKIGEYLIGQFDNNRELGSNNIVFKVDSILSNGIIKATNNDLFHINPNRCRKATTLDFRYLKVKENFWSSGIFPEVESGIENCYNDDKFGNTSLRGQNVQIIRWYSKDIHDWILCQDSKGKYLCTKLEYCEIAYSFKNDTIRDISGSISSGDKLWGQATYFPHVIQCVSSSFSSPIIGSGSTTTYDIRGTFKKQYQTKKIPVSPSMPVIKLSKPKIKHSKF